jgi:hypothetical protein
MKNKKFIEKEKKGFKKEWINIFFNCTFAILALLIPILFYKNNFLTISLLLVVAFIGLLKWKSWITLIMFIFGGIFGPISEIIAITYGVWKYTFPNFFSVPIWLFVLWGMAAAFLYQTALEFRKLGVKK